MSEADKMLHGIGYMKEYEDSSVEVWNYEEGFCIRFNKLCKSVDFQRKDKRQIFGLKYHRISIDMQELKAINLKCKELRMDIENKDKIILDLCGGTGSWSKFYSDNGYDVRVITLPDYDVCNYEPPKNIYGILAAPPCTMFSIARNDKTAKKPRDLKGGMEIVNACLKIIHTCLYDNYRVGQGLHFWALENPYSGYLKRFLGKPALVFEPYEYGDPYTKKTAIWGEFNEPKRNIVKPREYQHNCGARDFVSCVEHYADLKQIPDGYLEKTGLSKRTVLRSMTPLGFAKAFYEANK